VIVPAIVAKLSLATKAPPTETTTPMADEGSAVLAILRFAVELVGCEVQLVGVSHGHDATPTNSLNMRASTP
jgi:hypothetical protein